MKGKKILAVLACVFAVSVFVTSPANTHASEFQVPSVYSTIQAGIDAAVAAGGGIVRVAPGTYSSASGEMFPITLPSGVELIGAGSDVCAIDAGFSNTVINCVGDASSKIEGFLILNGGGPFGGGIMCENWSSPVIVNNIIAGSNIFLYGGGINCDADSFPLIANNVIIGNSAGFDGGGIYCYYSSPNIIHNTIIGNSAGRYGGGLYISRLCNPVIANNIILNNRASTGGGIYCYPPTFPNNSYNDMFGNIPSPYVNCAPGLGDIYADPDFVDYDPLRVDYTANDYHLQPYSLCVDAGTDLYLGLVAFDFDGNLRPLDGDGDESDRVDIGADEVIPPPVADAGSDQNISVGADCQATVTLDGRGSFDPGGGELTYTWSGPFGDIAGSEPTVTLGLGTHTILLTVSNGTETVTDEVKITVQDTTPPELDQPSLPDIAGECSAEITVSPTATDTCAGTIIGTTSDPLAYTEQGTHTVTWTFDDRNGNTVTQTQSVVVQDVTAPVPETATLPAVTGECSAEITVYPTATDNCAGTITGTTTDPLVYTEHGTHTVTWTFDDGNGNTSTQTQTVTVEDVTPPEIHLSDSTCVQVRRWQLASMLALSASDNCSSEVELIIDKVEIFNRGGRRVRGSGVYSIVGNDIYVYPRGNGWSVCITATAVDASGNTKTDRICRSLLKCNKCSAQMARLIYLLYLLWWRCHSC